MNDITTQIGVPPRLLRQISAVLKDVAYAAENDRQVTAQTAQEVERLQTAIKTIINGEEQQRD